MRVKLVAFFLSISVIGCTLQVQPWFGDVYEFHLLTGYTYYHYNSVDSAVIPLSGVSNNNLLFADLEFSFSPQWSLDTDIEFADTTFQSFSFRSYALQMRYLAYDDIIGDPISLSFGGNIRYVSSRSLKDVGCPYAANVNFEGTMSLGKEFDYRYDWRFRIWGFGAVGIANRGSPWVKGIIALEGNYRDMHKWAVYTEGFHGYGSKTVVNIANFFGYGRIRAKYVDLAASYGYRLGVWGTLRFEYRRRLAAARCPERVNFFTIFYLLPFSF